MAPLKFYIGAKLAGITPRNDVTGTFCVLTMTVQSQTSHGMLTQELLKGSGKFAEAPGNLLGRYCYVFYPILSLLSFTSFQTPLID